MRRRVAAAFAAALLAACGLARGAPATVPTVVSAEWEQIEYLPLPDGSVQVRARRRAPAAGAQAAVDAPGVAPAPKAAADQQAIIDSLKSTLAVDLSVPSSPAMAVLGMSGTEVQRPAFPRDFAASLVRGFDKDGKAKNALAIDIVPVALFFPQALIGGRLYEDSYWMRLKARTTLSLAAAQVESSASASQLAAGIRVGLVDYADPGLYWRAARACVDKAVAMVGIPIGRNVDDVAAVADAVSAANKCVVGADAADLWAKPALYAGYAQGWYSESGAIKDAGRSARALWASFSVGLPHRAAAGDAGAGRVRALLQLHLARKLDERAPAPAGTELLVREDRSEAIVRLRVGKEKWHAFIDGGLARVTSAGLASERIRRIGLGVEFQLRDDLWLVAGSVTEKGFAGGERNLVNTGLRFGQVPKAQFGLPGAKGE